MTRPRWRKMTWVLVAWCAIVVGVALTLGLTAAHRCQHQPGERLIRAHGEIGACNTSVGVGVVAILVLGAAVLAVLSLAWLLTRPRRVSVRPRG